MTLPAIISRTIQGLAVLSVAFVLGLTLHKAVSNHIHHKLNADWARIERMK